MRITSQNPEQTLTLGKNLGRELKPGNIVLLFGELGAGKTTLTQGISTGLGLHEYIRSPTFTIINEYQGRWPIYHMDLYRMETGLEIENLGLEEFFFGSGVVIVEWAEKLFGDINNKDSIGFGIEARLEIHISLGQNEERSFDILPIRMGENDSLLFALQ